MTTLIIPTSTGAMVEVTGRRFSHHVQGVQFWFFLHESINSNAQTVTHYASKKKFCDVMATERFACLGDDKMAAKMAIDRVIARVGEARVRSVLASAE